MELHPRALLGVHESSDRAIRWTTDTSVVATKPNTPPCISTCKAVRVRNSHRTVSEKAPSHQEPTYPPTHTIPTQIRFAYQTRARRKTKCHKTEISPSTGRSCREFFVRADPPASFQVRSRPRCYRTCRPRRRRRAAKGVYRYRWEWGFSARLSCHSRPDRRQGLHSPI